MTWAQSDWTDTETLDGEPDADPIEADQVDDVGGTDDGAEVEAAPTTYYANLDEFVREYLRHVYGCKIDGRNRVWAAEWWRYTGAVVLNPPKSSSVTLSAADQVVVLAAAARQ